MSARPRINWFSPLPPTRSDIARQTLTLLPELAQRAEVTLWSNESIYDESARDFATIKSYDAAHPPWREINRADATFYQMGNDPWYHEDIWRVSRQHPGMVILHDLKLQHFFAGLLTETKSISRHEYLSLTEMHHGPAGRLRAEAFLRGEIGVDELAEDCSLGRAAAQRALAVVIHSEDAIEPFARETGIPTAHLRLPATRPAPRDDSFIEKRDWQNEPYRLLVFGFLGPNRRLPSILKALAQFPERDRFHLDIFGTMDGAEKIVQLACRLGLGDLVTWHGFASEEELERALQRSHLALNLRFPSMGEASGSQLHVWQFALPALVSQTAWYATLPADAVGFVRLEHETEDIQMHLANFLADPQRYREMGMNGQRFVKQHCGTGAYADGIMELVARVPEFQAIWIARDLAERTGHEMRDGLSTSNVAAEIQRLVSGYFRPTEAMA
jgi:glycosyltransferase involved in cell wall biosynthesis